MLPLDRFRAGCFIDGGDVFDQLADPLERSDDTVLNSCRVPQVNVPTDSTAIWLPVLLQAPQEPTDLIVRTAQQLADSRKAARLNSLEVLAARNTLQGLTVKQEEHEQRTVQLEAAGRLLLREQYERDIESSQSAWQQAISDRAHLTASDADLSELRTSVLSGLKSPRRVTIAGASGSGKSSLIQDWLRSINFPAAEAEAAEYNHEAESRRVWATDEVMLTDCLGSPDAPGPVLTHSNMATADVFLFFMGHEWSSHQMSEVLLWAWRLRKTTQTIFVLPELDVHVAAHSK
ncbi:hypothetical protein WJX73_009165 [Symbiochloris irregularis]|uniref:IRG-type G domain-containing protein n=1 Tax=Symbiochloris irregularis TaxID=706552 RepID=A0AAW1NUC0_9CHLO